MFFFGFAYFFNEMTLLNRRSPMLLAGRGALVLLAGVALSSALPARDQTAGDGDCPPAPPLAVAPANPRSCLTLDARASVDSLAVPLTFRWRMGDGEVREGVMFDYCYATPGRYTIQLDVVDSTGVISELEFERVVDFTKPPVPEIAPELRFVAPAQAKVGEVVTFQITEASLPACLPPTTRFNWNFRDGLLAQGRTITHTFRRAGTFIVRVAVDGSGIGPACLPRTCVTQAIVIEP